MPKHKLTIREICYRKRAMRVIAGSIISNDGSKDLFLSRIENMESEERAKERLSHFKNESAQGAWIDTNKVFDKLGELLSEQYRAENN